MPNPPTVSALELSQALIRCPSITPTEAGALTVLQEALESIGFCCERFTFTDEDTPPVENLYARWGADAPNLCFAGHTDVVPVGDAGAWSVDPFGAEIKDGYLYGRGTEDMKVAIACFVAAASEAIAAGTVQGSLSLLITGDEEGPAINGTIKLLQAITKKGEKLDACIVGEPTNPTFIGEMAKIGRRGSLSTALTVIGKQGHAAYPQLAANPITPMAHILSILKQRTIDAGTEHFLPSNLEITSVDVGNPAGNVIPAQAKAAFNIRYNDMQTARELQSWIKDIVQAQCEAHGCTYEKRFHEGAEPFLTAPGPLSECVVKAIKAATGHTPDLSTTGGTSDARFIKDYCPVVEFGTTGLRAHQVDERVKLEDIDTLAQVYRSIIEGYKEM